MKMGIFSHRRATDIGIELSDLIDRDLERIYHVIRQSQRTIEEESVKSQVEK